MAWNMMTGTDDDPLERSLRQFPLAQRPPLGAAPYAMSPGVVDTTQTTVTERRGGGGAHGATSFKEASPRALANMDAGDALAAREIEATKALAKTEGEQAKVQAQAAEAVAASTRIQNDELDRRRAEHDARIEAKQRQYDDEAAGWARDKPSSFWADKGAGQKFLAGLGVALGAIGSGLTGRENGALSILERSQREHYQREQDRIEKRYRGLELIRGQRGDLQAAKERDIDQLRSKYLGYWDWAAKQTDAKLKKLGLNDEQAKTDVRTLQVEKARNAARQQILNDESKTITRGWSSERPSSTTTTTTLEGIKGSAGSSAGASASPLGVRGPGGEVLGTTGDKVRDQKASDYVSSVRDLVGVIDELGKSFEEYGRESDVTKAGAERESIHANLVMKVKEAAEMGAIDKGMIEIAEKMVPSGYGTFGGGPAKLAKFREMAVASAAKKLDGFGLPGQKVVGGIMSGPRAAAPGPQAATPAEHNEALDWARAHPGDPRAAAILQRVGVR